MVGIILSPLDMVLAVGFLQVIFIRINSFYEGWMWLLLNAFLKKIFRHDPYGFYKFYFVNIINYIDEIFKY